jgi:hypothetical protein
MKPWFKLILCVLTIWGFVLGVPILLKDIRPYREVIKNSEAMEIDNSALFYSEEVLTSKAELELNERLSFVE